MEGEVARKRSHQYAKCKTREGCTRRVPRASLSLPPSPFISDRQPCWIQPPNPFRTLPSPSPSPLSLPYVSFLRTSCATKAFTTIVTISIIRSQFSHFFLLLYIYIRSIKYKKKKKKSHVRSNISRLLSERRKEKSKRQKEREKENTFTGRIHFTHFLRDVIATAWRLTLPRSTSIFTFHRHPLQANQGDDTPSSFSFFPSAFLSSLPYCSTLPLPPLYNTTIPATRSGKISLMS